MQPAGRLFVITDVEEFCALYNTFGQIDIVYRCSYSVACGILMLHQSVMKYSRFTPNSRDGFCLAHTSNGWNSCLRASASSGCSLSPTSSCLDMSEWQEFPVG